MDSKSEKKIKKVDIICRENDQPRTQIEEDLIYRF